MGYSICYRSSKPMDDETRSKIEAEVSELCTGYGWFSCDPISFHDGVKIAGNESHLMGASKLSFEIDSDDVAEAKAAGYPDGTPATLIEILCQISDKHGVDWEFTDDESSSFGSICNGKPSPQLVDALRSFDELYSGFGEFSSLENKWDDSAKNDNLKNDEDDQDDGPHILKFPGS